MIRNPILPGFNADPSICRVGSDYYIAVSTFEWYPGVQIHHSKDLVNWTLVAHPLNRAAQLDMRGNPDSCGVWAPCLSYADGKFWLVYTDVKRFDGNFKDAHNYIVTAEAVEDDWSDPVYCNSSGFDPTLFHDDDGKKWFANMQWRHTTNSIGGAPTHPAFDGILLQQFNPEAGKLEGAITNIFPGSAHGLVEAPHFFKRNGYYYLTTAEGGTGYGHTVTMARARKLTGPYELHPNTFLMTSKDAPDAPIQRAGHGQMVETPEGDVYHTHLMGRPLPGLKERRCVLGRETGIQKCVWKDDGWLYLENGGLVPDVEVPSPDHSVMPHAPKPSLHRFNGETLPIEFQWLRTPDSARIFRLTGNALQLIGRESYGSWFEQALVARRQEHFSFIAETKLTFTPETYQQVAGLTHYYNRHKFHALVVTLEPNIGRVLTIHSCEGDWPDAALSFPMEDNPVPLEEDSVELRAVVDHATLQYYYRTSGSWVPIGPVLDASLISDEAGRGEHGSFTGAFIGMLAFDTSGRAKTADFEYFNYIPT
ncbi:MAG: glycoside hydrolase family 43 protein [Rhodobacteraceae bacterium]|nr:glycoside hydrolase family 43 protein [Paracoccaceae bacterium]